MYSHDPTLMIMSSGNTSDTETIGTALFMLQENSFANIQYPLTTEDVGLH